MQPRIVSSFLALIYSATLSAMRSSGSAWRTSTTTLLAIVINAPPAGSWLAQSRQLDGIHRRLPHVDQRSERSWRLNTERFAVQELRPRRRHCHAQPRPDLVVDTPTLSDSSPMDDHCPHAKGSPGESGQRLVAYNTDPTALINDHARRYRGGHGRGCRRCVGEQLLSQHSMRRPHRAKYYGACVDSMPGESDTTNNCSAVGTVSEFDFDSLPWV